MSTPSLSNFNPYLVPYQARVLTDMRVNFDYTGGKIHEILLSGSVGSAKSILLAHIAVTHCLDNKRARVCLGRLAMPDLKSTIFQTILEHIEEDLVEGVDYKVNRTNASIKFLATKSEIISRSWSDKKYKKGRSLLLSGMIFEELTENGEQEKEAYMEFRMRVGRLPHVKEQFVLSATNPDSPSHWAYRHFIEPEKKHDNRHVYYSVTTDNPFLPPAYIEELRATLDPRMARRMLHGEWLDITDEVIYYAYTTEKNFIADRDYEISARFPIDISFDFNIADGKPMSAICAQHDNGTFHFFNEFVVSGARTRDILEEMAEAGLFENRNKIRIFGDAAGKHRDTRSIKSDYDIIREFISNYRRQDGTSISLEMHVPLENPPVRTRHNLVNGQFENANGDHNAFVYRKCKTAHEGFRLTRLKKGADYIEDDSKSYQHITTAAGYYIVSTLKGVKRQGPSSVGRL